MTDDEKKLLIGDELSMSSTALIQLCWPDNERAPAIVGDFLAHLLGRAAALASSAVLGVVRPFEQRLSAVEARQNSNSARLNELHLRLNGHADHIDRLLDRLLPGAEVDQMAQAIALLALEVEALKSRQVGDAQ